KRERGAAVVRRGEHLRHENRDGAPLRSGDTDLPRPCLGYPAVLHRRYASGAEGAHRMDQLAVARRGWRGAGGAPPRGGPGPKRQTHRSFYPTASFPLLAARHPLPPLSARFSLPPPPPPPPP